jgi:hypothetical protein
VKVVMSTEIAMELRRSLPGFAFTSLRKGRRVAARCKKCYEVDSDKLSSLIARRNEISFLDESDLKKEEEKLRGEYNVVMRKVATLHPREQKKLLREVRPSLDASRRVRNRRNLLHIRSFSEYVRHTSREFSDVLSAVDWAMVHKCVPGSKKDAEVMAENLFEIGVTPTDLLDQSRSTRKVDSADDERIDLLDLVPED